VAFKPKQPLDLVEVQVAPPQAGGLVPSPSGPLHARTHRVRRHAVSQAPSCSRFTFPSADGLSMDSGVFGWWQVRCASRWWPRRCVTPTRCVYDGPLRATQTRRSHVMEDDEVAWAGRIWEGWARAVLELMRVRFDGVLCTQYTLEGLDPEGKFPCVRPPLCFPSPCLTLTPPCGDEMGTRLGLRVLMAASVDAWTALRSDGGVL